MNKQDSYLTNTRLLKNPQKLHAAIEFALNYSSLFRKKVIAKQSDDFFRLLQCFRIF